MDFFVVYGRSGTGKSEYIYNQIKKDFGSKKIYLVVPEQSNLTAEQKLFEKLDVESLMDVEVLTLSRMATRVLNEIGEKNRNILSKVGKNMIIYDILLKEKSNLRFLGKSDKNIEIVSNIITEFKKHNIDLDLMSGINIEENYTRLKFEDAKLIMSKYTEKIQNTFIDENDELTLLYENLNKVDLFKDSIIYFDDFLGFTSQEYKIFEVLLKQASKVTVTIPSDSLFITSKESDIFYFNKKFANTLIKIASDNNCEIKNIFLEDNYRAKSEDLKFLERVFSKNDLSKFNGEVNGIKLLAADNPYVEVDNIARIIFDLVKNKNYRYKDFIIISGNIDDYKEDIKNSFTKYNIPVFIDEKKELNQNLLIRFIIALLDIFAKNWSLESVMNFLKIGLFQIENFNVFEFENYCIKWGIKYKKWFEKFEYEAVNDKQNILESNRQTLVSALLEFKKKLSERKSVKDITKCLYDFLIDNNINESLDKKVKDINNIEIVNEYNTSYVLFISLLDELVSIFGDEIVSFEKYKELLQVGFNTSELGKIPATQDEVVFGDISRSRGNDVKIEFLIGVNDGKIPSSSRVEGFFNDDDRKILGDLGLELAKDSIDNMYEEQFNIYRMLTLPSDRLYVSYSLSDKTGEQLRSSILIKKLNKIFGLKKEVLSEFDFTTYNNGFDIAIDAYKNYSDGEEISEELKNLIHYYEEKEPERFKYAENGLHYSNKAEHISKDNILKLYGKNLQTSISKLEQYEGCPFSFHLKYGLKIKEKNELQIRSLDTGNFMHEVLDSFFEKTSDLSINIKDIDDENIDKIVFDIINELLQTSRYYVFSSSKKYKILSRRLRKVVLDSVKYIIYTLKNSKFDVLGHEIEFSKNSEFKPIVVELEDGKKVELTGKIDRVDIGKLNNKEYVRIIDYKSSVKTLDFNKIVAGLQIQLITYLDDICIQKEFEPSGVLYMGLIDNIVKAPKNFDDEKIAEEIKKNFKMQGVILADVDVARMMDTTLESGYSNIVPLGISKTSGEIIESKSSVIKSEDFNNLQLKVRKLIKQISKEILDGNIEIKPYYYQKSTPCDYCEYKTICSFVPGIKNNEYRYIMKDTKDRILEKLREDNENGNN